MLIKGEEISNLRPPNIIERFIRFSQYCLSNQELGFQL